MSILSYNFSIQGQSHKERNTVCQDSSLAYIHGAWHMLAVADGVGSCAHSDEASKVAIEAVRRFTDSAFPLRGNDDDYLALVRTAAHYAANALDKYVFKNNGKPEDFQTTLALALYNGRDVYYANAGDSGILAMDDNGCYHILSTQQDTEYGEVIPLSSRSFEVGKADFCAAAVLCMTDGLLEWCCPVSLKKHKFKVNVPRVSIIAPDKIWFGEEESDDKMMESISANAQELLAGFSTRVFSDDHYDETYGDLSEKNLRDDLSVAAAVNTDVLFESVQWESPAKKTALESFQEHYESLCSLYPTRAVDMLREDIKSCNPDISEEALDEVINSIITPKVDKNTQEEPPLNIVVGCPDEIDTDDTDIEEYSAPPVPDDVLRPIIDFSNDDEIETKPTDTVTENQDDKTEEVTTSAIAVEDIPAIEARSGSAAVIDNKKKAAAKTGTMKSIIRRYFSSSEKRNKKQSKDQ